MTIEGAISELQNLIKADDVPFYYNGVIKKVIETIIDECKPKVGEWVERDNGDYYECSACGDAFVLLEGTPYDNYYNYCPNCGARMIRSE